MTTPLTGRLLGRRAIALLAAYALALQMVLPLVAAAAAPRPGPICATDSRDGPAPLDHGTNGEKQGPCCVGIMLCAAAALPPQAGPAFAPRFAQIQSSAQWAVFSSVERSPLLRGAHSPRGPPVA
jgi:hypothetical protein